MMQLSESLTLRQKATLNWRKAHPEQVKETKNKWAEANRQKLREDKQRWMSKPENRIRHTLGQAKRRATKDGRAFDITIEDLLPLPAVCPVLGIELNYAGTKVRGFVDNSPSIDRIDSSKGYIKGNVQIISWRANRVKSDASVAELEAVIKYMKGHQPCN
jgi:hypothetical protein